MRRFVILVLALTLGATLLWHFEEQRKAEARRTAEAAEGRGGERLDSVDWRPTEDTPEGPEVTAPGPGDPTPEDLDTQERLYEGEWARSSGGMVLSRQRKSDQPEDIRAEVVVADKEPLNEQGTRYRLRDISAEAFVLVPTTPPTEALRSRVHADSTEVEVNVDRFGFMGFGEDQSCLLQGVVLEQLRGSPLTPLTFEAPRMLVWFFGERYESVEDDLVTFRSRSVRGSGRGFAVRSADADLRFHRGAEITVELGEGRVARIAAQGEGAALSIVEEPAPRRGDARRVRVVAAGDVRLDLVDQDGDADGEEAGTTLDADALDVVLEFVEDADRPRVSAARADGRVTMRRGADVYRGDTAVFEFDGAGNPLSCVLEDDPSLDYALTAPGGRELRVEVSGAGPLTAVFVPGDGAGQGPDGTDGDLGVTFLGPGRVVALDRGDEIRFEDRLVSAGPVDGSRLDATLRGDVRALGLLGDLAAEVIVASYAVDGGLEVRTEGPTRVFHRPAGGDESYRMRAAGGMHARLTEAGWYVERAEEVSGEAVGADPYRVEARVVEDVDLATRTLSASTNVLYRSTWGSAFAPTAMVRGLTFVELRGTELDPVRLDVLAPEDALGAEPEAIAGLRTGWLHAPSMTLSDESVLAEGGVATQLETLGAVWAMDAESILLKRRITGRALGAEGGAPAPGEVRARRAEELRVEANFVREARYDALDASGVFRAQRLELDAALVDPADVPGAEAGGGAALDTERTVELHLLGEVDARLAAFAPRGDLGMEGDVALQTWELAADEANLVRQGAELDADGRPGRAPFTLTAEVVQECRYQGGGRYLQVAAGQIEAEGAFGAVLPTDEGEAPDLTGSTFVARDTVVTEYKAAADQPLLRARGEVFVLVDGERGTLREERGKRVRATGVTPGDGLPYTLTAKELRFRRDLLEADGPELDFSQPVPIAELGVSVRRITAGAMTATPETISFNSPGPVAEEDQFRGYIDGGLGSKPDIKIGYIELSVDALRRETGGDQAKAPDDARQSPRTLGPFEPVPPPDPVAWPTARPPQEEQGEQGEQEDDAPDIGGVFHVELPTGLSIDAPNSFRDPNKGGRFRLEQASVVLPTSNLTFDADVVWLDIAALMSGAQREFLVDAISPVIRGGTADRPWSLECATIESRVVGDEVMITLVAPRITAGTESARADYLALWVDRAAWNRFGGSLRDPGAVPEPAPDVSNKPNFLAELLFEIQTEEYARYARAVYMEGGVEIARADRRSAKGSRLYIDVQNASAWLEDAELVYPLQSRGEEVPLRVRTERFETDEEGALTAQGATLTTCDHDVPHFVVRTQLFKLEPRPDGRWRFGAEGNVLKFEGGPKLPLPSIGNLVLDEEFGVEGFENEAGEVTPLRDIAIARTPRFGTVLGAAFRFDIGDVGEWVAKRIGMDTDHLRGKWDTHAQWLGSRGPLLGMGLFLREREPGNDPDEDFRLDAFLGGIPDGGQDRGLVRVPESERDDLRLWGYVRSRYPIVRGEWVDVAFASQTDAGVQPEFYEGEYLRFEQRDTFVNWRKSFGADFLAARAQKRVDDFRSQKEELPTLLAYRGERLVGTFTGAPILWGGSLEAGYYTRRQGELGRDVFSDLPLGADPALGNAETGRADLRQRLSLPVQTTIAGLKATPFLEARGIAWSDTLADGGDGGRGAVKGGAELSTVLHKVTGDGYLHTLAPRVSASTDLVYEDSGDIPIPLDDLDRRFDGTTYEAGLRALWLRPATFENLDLDVRGILRTDRENGLDDSTELGVLGEYITRYGDGTGQIGMRHDARYDVEDGETVYTRSALAIRPDDEFVAELQYGQARAIDTTELYETAGLMGRWRVDPKWEIEARYVHDVRADEQLFTQVVLRRFSHDFVFDISVLDRAGEGGTTFSFSLAPLLGWSRTRMGMLDRR